VEGAAWLERDEGVEGVEGMGGGVVPGPGPGWRSCWHFEM